MKRELPIYIEDFNMSAQYHNFLYSVVMTKDENRMFFYQKYVPMLVKHMHHSHVDFAYDGIYSCDRGPLQKFTLRGPIHQVHQVIQESLDAKCYVVLNINEGHLPYRDAYQKYYFRHDLLIYGYDSDESLYLTVGLDDKYHYRCQEYQLSTIEKAYFYMREEWDFELFIFRLNPEWKPEFSVDCLKTDVQEYLAGGIPNRKEFYLFLKGEEGSTGYTNESYYEYYGVGIYDYMMKRIKRYLSLWDNGSKEVDGALMLGETDTRSVQALYAQKRLLYHFLLEEEINQKKDQKSRDMLMEESEKLQNMILHEKMLLMKTIFGGGRKEGKGCLKLLLKIKEMDLEWMNHFLEYLESDSSTCD